MTRRISAGILGGCLLAIFAMQLPPTSGGGTAQIGWAIGQIFGGSDPAALERATAVGAAPIGDFVKDYATDAYTQAAATAGENSGAWLGSEFGEMMEGIGVLDPVIITADVGAGITAGEAAVAGAAIGADIGSAIVPIVGTIIGAAVCGL
jgi:hypothetical protein